jgi:xanthine dehydrogenase accessory factor
MKRTLLDRLLASRARQEPVALVSDLSTGQHALVFRETATGDFGLVAEDLAAVRAMLAADETGLLRPDLFVQSNNPPLRLILVGAVHIAQALVPLALATGYHVTIIDPRGSFATADRFPGVALSTDWPDEAMAAVRPDHRTAVVTLTHDPKLDDPALAAAVLSPAFYIGALGSRGTHAKRLARLAAEGLDEAALQRIHGPVGLAIGAKTQSEIAVSILAEIVAVRRGARP